MTQNISSTAPRLSVVIPMRNESGNIIPLISEIEAALAPFAPYEIITVNDGSMDDTGAILDRLCREKTWLTVVTHLESLGQSAAIRTGVKRARSDVIATLDGDGQNNPVFLPKMLEVLAAGGDRIGLVQGQRQNRQDTAFKRWQSRMANRVRDALLKDQTRDTGCGLKIFRRDVYGQLPYFDALHRFMPALVRREGYDVAYVDVVDRLRGSGTSNYGFFDRLWVGILDLMGVWWLLRRKRKTPRAMT